MKHKKIKKQKKNNLVALHRELERLFVNNPIDTPGAGLTMENYYSIIKAAEIMTSYHDLTLATDSREWNYFSNKWNALHNFIGETQLEEFTTYHDIISAILSDWDSIKRSPYTYRCVAALIRMLGEEQG